MKRTHRSICTSRRNIIILIVGTGVSYIKSDKKLLDTTAVTCSVTLYFINTWRCWLNRYWTANEEVVCWVAPSSLGEYVHWTRRDRASNDSVQGQLLGDDIKFNMIIIDVQINITTTINVIFARSLARSSPPRSYYYRVTQRPRYFRLMISR